MLWEVELHPKPGEPDREGRRVLAEAQAAGVSGLASVAASRSFLVEGGLGESDLTGRAVPLLADAVVETFQVRPLPAAAAEGNGGAAGELLNVLFKPGVTDNVGQTARQALRDLGLDVSAVAVCRKYRVQGQLTDEERRRLELRVLANDAVEHVIRGPLPLQSIGLGGDYKLQRINVPLRKLSDAELQVLSRTGQLYLSLPEMQAIQAFYKELGREPSDIELETIAQTWSEHCSHKTLRGRIRYEDEHGPRTFENLLKETVFGATEQIRRRLGAEDWCVSVFRDNAGVVRFDDEFDVCIKVETHNHPSALEPYGGANTGLGGVIRDPLGTGLGARPVCNTDVFCFAPPDTPHAELPPGVLHPRNVLLGVVAGVRDYGNRMGIPTVNGAVFFDDRYLGNPLVYCGNVAMLPVGKAEKQVKPGDLIVAVGGRTGRDGIHGATFSSAELTHESETLSGGAVQIGNAVVEKMLLDVILAARDQELYTAITDCGAGGFSSAVGEMGEHTGAEVWLEQAPLKYSGLSYTEIWISEAQERMVLAVPPRKWDAFRTLCAAEGVEATVIGKFTGTNQLLLKYAGHTVGELPMSFLHDGRPPVVRDAVYRPAAAGAAGAAPRSVGGSRARSLAAPGDAPLAQRLLRRILSSWNVCSKEWIVRQYDHEVQGGSVVKPFVGVHRDGPSDAAVLRPRLESSRGLVISNGMNPRYGDFDPYWMAASAIDEALRNAVAVGADPQRIAILDNFCWGNTERPETLGSLVRAALGCRDAALAFGAPFVSGKDSLNNEFSFQGPQGPQTIAIPPSLLITALGQIADVQRAVTMDLKQPGHGLWLAGVTAAELGGSHAALVADPADRKELAAGGVPEAAWSEVPRVGFDAAPRTFAAVHACISQGLIAACHDLSEGGLAAAAAEMALAGRLGAALDAAAGKAQGLAPLVQLFSESNSRFLIEVDDEHAAAMQQAFAAAGARAPVRVGTVTDSGRLKVTGSTPAEQIDVAIDVLRNDWRSPLRWD